MKFKDILDAIGHTPLVELPRLSPKKGVRIFAKLEGNNPTGSVKDRIALYMIRQAEENGNLTRDKTILEATSGNTGISLAMIGQRKGYRVKVVMPESVSPERVELLHLFGAEIVFSEGSGGTNRAIEVAQEMAAKDGQYFMPYQYGNEANPQAHYETTAPEIIEDLPDIDAFVAGLGTGGTLMGVGRRLKEHDSNTRIVAVVPNPGDRIMGLRSLEEGFTPPIVDLGLLDSRIVVDSKQAFVATRELTKKEGLFAGISSGSVIVCAQRVAQRMEKGNIVALLADGGWKYLSTRLWTRAIEDMESDIDSLIWW
jgi:cysteine synthase B